MTNEEANKVIAKYMGATVITLGDSSGIDTKEDTWLELYTESLDSLVPVWERLNDDHNTAPTLEFGRMEGHVVCFWTNHYDPAENTISTNFHKAAAHATAKAILKLKERNEK